MCDTPSDKKAEENKKEIDPSLDVTSEHFDPLKALYSENVYIPYKNAKVYDNISKFESLVLRPMWKTTSENEATTSKQSTNSSTSISSNTQTNTAKANKYSASDETVVRRFLPHQRKAF